MGEVLDRSLIFMHAGGVEIAEADCHWDLEWSRCHGPMAGMWQLEAVFLARDLQSSDVAGFIHLMWCNGFLAIKSGMKRN